MGYWGQEGDETDDLYAMVCCSSVEGDGVGEGDKKVGRQKSQALFSGGAGDEVVVCSIRSKDGYAQGGEEGLGHHQRTDKGGMRLGVCGWVLFLRRKRAKQSRAEAKPRKRDEGTRVCGLSRRASSNRPCLFLGVVLCCAPGVGDRRGRVLFDCERPCNPPANLGRELDFLDEMLFDGCRNHEQQQSVLLLRDDSRVCVKVPAYLG